MTGPRRTLLSIVSMMAMLLSAGGIAYMASISYPDELGIVDARLRKHQERASQIADRLREQIASDLDYRATLTLVQLAASPSEDPAFVLSKDGSLLFPSMQPLRAGTRENQGGVVPARGFQTRQKALQRARRLEHSACALTEANCGTNTSDLRTAAGIFEGLSGFSDTGAEALLGLARIHRANNQMDLAARRYVQLTKRFGDRVSVLDIPFRLLADIGLSEVSASVTTTLTLLRNLVGRQYEAPNSLLEVAAYAAIDRLRSQKLAAADRGQLDTIEAKLVHAQADTIFASRISTRLVELQASASPEIRSIVAPWNPQDNLVYATNTDQNIYGTVLSELRLQELATHAASELGLHQALIVRVEPMYEGAESDTSRRARVSLGPLLPHLALVLWDQEDSGNGLADIAEARRRHRAITGGLVVILVLGLIATIRGAARERELARLKSDFVSTVSHELKTPLTSIRMFAEMLQEGVAGEDRKRESRYHSIIVKESERLGLLIANLLDYSQIERGIRQYTDSHSSPAELARQAGETFSRMRDDEDQILTVEVAEDVSELWVHVDGEVIIQCLINLLSNAAKYGNGAPIRLKVQRSANGSVALQVIDRGPGIPSSEQGKIFREFYRAPEAVRSAIEGTGLGLALVKRHVEAQGGTASVSSILGKGATFTLTLPVVKS